MVAVGHYGPPVTLTILEGLTQAQGKGTMPIPRGWDLRYSIVNNNPQLTSIRGICPHCGNASTFQAVAHHHILSSTGRMVHLVATCNYAPCHGAVYVLHSLHTGLTSIQRDDDFYLYPSGSIDKPHPAIPAQVVDDWIEAQKALQVGAPKATAVMLRRVLYSVLMDKGCKLKPLKDGVKQLITEQRLPKIFDDWLMAIHDDGHDGAHPDRALQVSAENVMETMEYTSELLRYLYIEPHEFAERKARNVAPVAHPQEPEKRQTQAPKPPSIVGGR